MTMEEMFKRRIRIEGRLDDTSAYSLKLTDLETGEAITGVYRCTLYLDARNVNKADVLYYAQDEQGKFVAEDGEPVSRMVTIDNPEVAVTAFERLENA